MQFRGKQAAALILAWTYPLCLLSSIATFEGKKELNAFKDRLGICILRGDFVFRLLRTAQYNQ